MDDGMLAWTEDNLLRQVVYEMKRCARISRRPRCGGRGRGPALIGNKIKLFVAGTRQPHRPPPRSLRQGAGAGSRKVAALLGNNEPPLARACLLGRYRCRPPLNSRNTDTPAIPALLLLRSH